MSVTQASLEAANTPPPVASGAARHVCLFDEFGTDGCLLDCKAWSWKLSLESRNATSSAQKSELRKESRRFAKAIVQEQRQKLQSSSKVANAKLKLKREPFRLADLEGSAANGCGSCRFFANFLESILSASSSTGGDPRALELEWIGYFFSLKVRDPNMGASFSFHFFSPPANQTIMQGLRPAHMLSGDTSSSSSLDRARAWIQSCETSHAQCGRGRDVPLPKRCLDLAPGIAGASDIRLAETDGIVGTYACLSHCWGADPKPIRTTSSTIQDHLNGIPFAALPGTFADAVLLARELGLRYLWIDSLCIVQDSAADWQAESGKMASIYHNSFVTIASISSPDSRGGCFSRGTPGDLCFCVDVPDGSKTLIAARVYEGEGLVDDLDAFQKSFPALSRAWIYQERILSRRILYCTHRELRFECRRDTACECGNTSMLPHPSPGTEAAWGTNQAKKKYAELDGVHDKASRLLRWQKTVMQYTKLHMTHGSDKLPALSGCAQDFDRQTGGSNGAYAAGLWQATLAQGLLWLVNWPFDGPRPGTWRAPSWSWASVDTPNGIMYVHPDSSRNRRAFQDSIDAVECAPEGVDGTGGVRSGSVRLRAALFPAYLRRVCRPCTTSRRKMWTVESDSWLATRTPKITPCPSDGHEGLHLGGATTCLFPDYRYQQGDLDLEPRRDGLLCRHARAYLLYLYDNRRLGSDIVTEFFLVLRKIANADGSASYERIALFNIVFKSEAERDVWFNSENKVLAEKEALVTIV